MNDEFTIASFLLYPDRILELLLVMMPLHVQMLKEKGLICELTPQPITHSIVYAYWVTTLACVPLVVILLIQRRKRSVAQVLRTVPRRQAQASRQHIRLQCTALTGCASNSNIDSVARLELDINIYVCVRVCAARARREAYCKILRGGYRESYVGTVRARAVSALAAATFPASPVINYDAGGWTATFFRESNSTDTRIDVTHGIHVMERYENGSGLVPYQYPAYYSAGIKVDLSKITPEDNLAPSVMAAVRQCYKDALDFCTGKDMLLGGSLCQPFISTNASNSDPLQLPAKFTIIPTSDECNRQLTAAILYDNKYRSGLAYLCDGQDIPEPLAGFDLVTNPVLLPWSQAEDEVKEQLELIRDQEESGHLREAEVAIRCAGRRCDALLLVTKICSRFWA